MGGYDTPNGGYYDFNGNLVNLPDWGYGLGLGIKTNLSEPIPGVFFQGLSSLTFSQDEYETSPTTVNSQNVQVGFSDNDSQR